MSVLWEIPKDNAEQHRLRRELVTKINQLRKLVSLWMKADELLGQGDDDESDEDEDDRDARDEDADGVDDDGGSGASDEDANMN